MNKTLKTTRQTSKRIHSNVNRLWSDHPWRPRGSQSGREKGRDESFQLYGRKSPWIPTLTELFPADAGSWLDTKNALYYCAQLANSFSWVLFVSSYTTAIVSPHLPGSFTKLVRARETFIFYFPNQKRRNYRWVEKTFGMLSAGAICPENILFVTHHNVS